MRYAFLVLCLLLLASTAFAQSTTVTLQVTDAASQTWNNGTYSAVLTPPPGAGPVQFLLNGAVMTPGQITVSGSLNGTGGASFSLSQNAAITPVNTTWTITVCPQATSSCFKAGASISGATQSVTLTPPAIIVTLANPPYSATAYADSEVTGVVVGSAYYNLVSQSQRVCTVVSGSTCTTWAGSSGGAGSQGTVGGTSNSAAPIVGVYLGPQCPVANTGNCFNSPADTQQSQTCSWTAATPSTVTCGVGLTLITGSVTGNVATYSTKGRWQSMAVPSNWVAGNNVTIAGFVSGDTYLNQTCTISSTTATTIVCPLTHANASSTSFGTITNTSVGPFVAADVGKQVAGWHDCEAFTASGTMGLNSIANSTAPLITSFISQTQVQITTSLNAQATQNGCFVWGHPDDAGAAAADAAYVSYPYCPRLILAASNYMFTQPHFYNNPIACAQEGTAYNNNGNGAGNVFYAAGFDVEGRGVGATVIYLMPNFPNGDSCNRGPAANACFAIPQLGRWSNFQITGGSQPNGNISGTPKVLIYGVVATVDHFTCTNYGAYLGGGNTLDGFQADLQTQFDMFNSSGCGNVGLDIPTGTGAVTGRWVSIENSFIADVSLDGPGQGGNLSSAFTCYDCKFLGSESASGSSTVGDIFNFGGWITLYRPIFSSGAGAGTGPFDAYLGAVSGSILVAHDAVFYLTTGNATSIACSAACTNYLQNTTLSSAGTGKNYADFAGSKLYDQCGNNWGAVSTLTINGQVFGEACSAAQGSLVAGNLALSGGWGSTAAVTAPQGGAFPNKFTITNSGTGQGASPTITYTYPASIPQAPISCTATQIGGTNATGTFTSSALSNTGVTFTFSLTPTAASTEIVQVTCVTP